MKIAGEVSVEIEGEREGEFAAVAEDTDELADLSIEGLNQLVKAGKISTDEHARAFRRKSEREDLDDK